VILAIANKPELHKIIFKL